MQHKYKVDQIVDIISAPRLSNRPSGPCRVLVRLPFEGDRLQYRVQSLAEKNQRVVNEEDLQPSKAHDDAQEAEAHFAPLRVVRV
jgi:hypothetical protein